MDIDIVSVFPEYFDVLNLSLLGKAQERGLLAVRSHNLRQWTHDVHQSVDDTPVGGGAGMVMKPEVWAECLDELLGIPADAPANAHAAPAADSPVLIFPNPSAPLFTQQDATALSHAEHLVFGCGRYEGYDARIPQYYRERGVDVREYSIGDYVLNGGEVAVSVMLEAITRLLPGFMGNADSIVEESYTGENALLEHNQYTKPASWRSRQGEQIPPRRGPRENVPTAPRPHCAARLPRARQAGPQDAHVARLGGLRRASAQTRRLTPTRALTALSLRAVGVHGGLAVVARVGDLPSDGRFGSLGAHRPLEHDHAVARHQAARGEIAEQTFAIGSGERIRRVDEHHVERLAHLRLRRVPLGFRVHDARVHRLLPRGIVPQCCQRMRYELGSGARCLHHHQFVRATAQRLDAERAGSAEQIEHARTRENAGAVEAREHGLLRAVGGRPRLRARRGERHALESSCNHTHVFRLSRPLAAGVHACLPRPLYVLFFQAFCMMFFA